MTMNRIASSLLAALLIASPMFATAGIDDQRERADREKERQQERVERESDLYDEGTDALDENDYARAARSFRRVAEMKMEHADAALYWLARSQNELGQRADALSTLVELQKAYPKSHWAEDSKALEVEIRQKSGAPVDPKQVADDDVKLMVLNGLMGSDPDKAVPVLEKVINGSSSLRVKERAITMKWRSMPTSHGIVGSHKWKMCERSSRSSCTPSPEASHSHTAPHTG